ncbi:MAG: flagellar filament capping protein FliD [Myxococcales bacterium]|nr:flagellar filament capping protein FliD [Myxococcales bacterium]MDD9970233.1 flagellar filament capping protein FliD [Myxococcales bacterium]
MVEPLFSFSGIASGIDTASIVRGLVQIERQPITRMEKQQTDLRGKQSKLDTLSGLLSTLQTKGEALDERTKVLTSSASSSQDDALTVTADGGASLGTYSITVSELAKAERSYSDPFSASDEAGLLTAGTLGITVGSESEITVDVDANTTLDSLAAAINASGADVTAGVLSTDLGYRLQITGNNTGADQTIAFTGDTGIGLNLAEVQAAQDAELVVDGFDVSRSTNLITDAISGVTLDLRAQTTGAAEVTVQRDPDALADLVQEYVNAYNAVNERVAYELSRDSQEGDSLASDSTVRTVSRNLRNTLIDTVDGLSSPYNYLASIGVSIDRAGKLEFERTELEEALADDPEAVSKLLAGDESTSTDGLMALMDETIDQLTNSTDGLITTRKKGIDLRIDNLDDQIARMELRIGDFEDRIRAEFTAMETAVSLAQGQGAQLAAMLGGLA